MSRRCFLCLFMIVGLTSQWGAAQENKAEKKAAPKPAVKAPPMNVVPPTHADVPYGKHERQVIDFYQAKSDTPTPLVFYIHGGGWQGGSKTGFNVKPFLEAGISGEGSVARRRSCAAVRALEGEGVEHRQGPHRRDGRFGRRLLVVVARVP
jgi:hypothetical protein